MTTPLIRAGTLFGALAEPMRLAILDRLRTRERSVGELTDGLRVGQSLISFHLKVLRDAGLVFHRKDGRVVWYAIDPAGVTRIERLVGLLRGTGDEAELASRAADLEMCMDYINND